MIEINRIASSSPLALAKWQACESLCFDGEDKQFIEDALLNERASVYQITGDSVDLTMIARNEGREFIIMIMKGKGLRQCAQDIKRLILDNGYTSIRYHTNKKGMTRLLRAIGFSVKEWVMSCHG